jgi:glycine/sarcosine N-methyltransferase
MYDTFSSDYDRFVNWENRLAAELPWIENLLQALGQPPARVIDAACGTGMHVIALAQKGYPAAGADISVGMVEQARLNAAEAGVSARFEAAGFGELEKNFGAGSFDALLCLGNSLPHLLDQAALRAALLDFNACLRAGGLLLVQNRNFDAVMAGQQRWMEPQGHLPAASGEAEYLFLRFYDFDPDGLITFNVVTLRRQGKETWQQQIRQTRLYPLRAAELSGALQEAGFEEIQLFGSMSGEGFDPSSSGNLLVTARKGGG